MIKMEPSGRQTTLEGSIERVTFYSEDNHYTIAKFRVDQTNSLVTIVGTLPEPNPGATLQITGTWETHPRFGQQVKISNVRVMLPASVGGIRKYLESGFVKGIGPKTVGRIVDHFQEETLRVIEEHPERLLDVRGIGREIADRVSRAWKEHHAVHDLMRFLDENGIKTSHGARIFREYGIESLDVLKNDPFRLAEDIPGIGFIIADTLIQNSDIPYDESDRAQACIIHLMHQFANDGNMFMYERDLLSQCESAFHIDPKLAHETIELLAGAGNLVFQGKEQGFEEDSIYLKQMYEAEQGIAIRLNALLSLPVTGIEFDSDQITHEVLKRLAIKLSPEQMEALEGVLRDRVVIVTGGPGTGKTTLIRAVATICEALGDSVCLAAPTGRAARRLSEITGRKASTLHKLLGFNPVEGGFDRDQDHPIEADMLIVDEVSMVDALLMYHFLQAVYLDSRVVLVGDIFQLPSVGPGNVLKDLIHSNKIRTFELNEIFRQARQSSIILNAHLILQGRPPEIESDPLPGDLSDFYFIEQGRPEMVVKTVVDLCKYKIPERFALESVDGIQVLTPMHKGLVGTLNLNQELQKGLNPQVRKIKVMGNTFSLNDKVMHLRNNYQKEVFNGDIGKICDIDEKEETLSVEYEGRIVAYHFTELDELTLAYAITVHKSQGSEYPAVIIPIMTQHYALLQRNLLYTAITRGKKLVVIIGTRKALSIALNNDKPRQRLSGLAGRLN